MALFATVGGMMPTMGQAAAWEIEAAASKMTLREDLAVLPLVSVATH
jgi:hypothetical protein